MAQAGGKAAGRSRSGLLYTGLSLAMVLVIMTFALTVSQSPPPAIAELSPQAEQIKTAPPEQSSALGSGDGGGGLALDPTTTTSTTLPAGATTLAPKRQPRQRRCVGQPLRQTEDPQSPPCVASWDGTDNGGATTKGVTAEEIRVAVPTADGKLNRHWEAVARYFNVRYEMYGRHLRLIPYKHSGHNVPCSTMKADAIRVAEEIDAFASLLYSIQRGNESCYYDELARRGVISIQASHGTASASEAHFQRFAPYHWAYLASIDKILALLGDFVCKNLSGRPPAYALGAQRAAAQRRFGLVTEEPIVGAPALDHRLLTSAMRSCGAEPLHLHQATNADPPERTALAKQAVLRMKEQGVTTVVCLCDASVMVQYMWLASTQEGYFPEWIVHGYMAQDTDPQINVSTQQNHKTQVFGVRTWNKALPRSQGPYWFALREADPTFPAEQWAYSLPYWDMLVLTSGIQAAGPRLTPHSFQDGLYATRFPNPGCGGPPFYQACVGFGPGNHTMIQDGTLVWFDNNVPPRDTDVEYGGPDNGAYCYVDDGRRYRPGHLPAGVRPFFQPTCT